ncbi:hypothetical protein HG536_0B04750 [Torulaspora globosa]|uniref:Uncharacterized protein n=1 Tax=Torulaspora globosa TaxID=48254 RepID=A0A7G3ZDM5_9SACH|nr:uncharacterized protein HG536_0B04750 [Torulaspora globosa]QLL31611.1 hypothetical protein HG536_0B04750 [Torulaspora globosa]
MIISPCFISLVDEEDKPLLVYVPSALEKDVNTVLKYNVLCNMALDYFENQLFKWSSLDTKPDIKFLFDLEGIAAYGLVIQQVGLKVIVGFSNEIKPNGLNDDNIDDVFTKIKKVYLRAKLNPFVTDTSNANLAVRLKEKFGEEFPWTNTVNPV